MFEGNTCLNEPISIRRDVSRDHTTCKCMLTTNLNISWFNKSLIKAFNTVIRMP